MDEKTMAVVLETLVQRWARTTRCLRELPEGVDAVPLLQLTWTGNAALRSRCGLSDEAPRPWTSDDTYRVRVELSRLRLDLEEEWNPPAGDSDVEVARPTRVAARACALTGVLLGWPDGTLNAPPPRAVWELIGESLEVLNRSSAQCASEIGDAMEALDQAGAARSTEGEADEEWATSEDGYDHSLGPGA